MNNEISIIIPMFNMGYAILDTLKSLDKQTDKGFKVILVDDGSTDDSASKVKQFVNASNLDIQYIYQNNQGVSKARNSGLDHCDTPYVLFCDADDKIPYEAIGLYRKYIDSCDVVAGLVTKKEEDLQMKSQNVSIQEGIDSILWRLLYKNTTMHFCGFIYKKSILDNNSIRFSEDIKYGEDEEFTWKYLCHCTSACLIEVPTYFYRFNPSSASHVVSFSRTQVIDSMIRVCSYYHSFNNPFAKKLYRHGIPRAKLAILKQFACCDRADLYDELVSSSSYKYSIFRLLDFPDVKIRLSAALFAISPKLFYNFIKKIK